MTPGSVTAPGAKVRSLRRDRGMRLVDLAAETGLSVGYLSQIERDQVNPSLATMRKIANAFSVAIGQLFDNESPDIQPENGRAVIRGHERRIATFSHKMVTFEIVSSSAARNLVMLHMKAMPGAESGKPLGHGGQECGLIVAGRMEFWLDDEYYVLLPGDSIYVDANVPHHWRCSGDEMLEVIWSVSPPIY